MEDEKYRELMERYPCYVSKEQLYVICRISKQSAKHLLDTGIIPCEDTGKKTRRYRIAMKDIIAYLKNREKSGNAMISSGETGTLIKSEIRPRTSYAKAVLPGQEEEVRRYFEYISTDYPDVLNMYDAADMTGLALVTIQKLTKSGTLRFIKVDRHPMIPKPYMLDFMSSPKFLCIKSNSTNFKRVLRDFSIWRERGNSKKSK